MKATFDHVQLADDRWVAEGTITQADGSVITHRYVFFADTMEWRAAEYRIDPADTATLLDIALAESLLTEEDWAEGEHLSTAPDIDTARRDHIARCAKVKLRHRLSTRTKAHPCAVIATDSPMDDEAISLKRTLVERERARIAAERTAAMQATPRDRLAELRAAVERNS